MQRDWFSGLGSDGMDELMELAVEYAGGNHRWNSRSVELAAQPDFGLPGLVVSLASSLLKLGLCSLSIGVRLMMGLQLCWLGLMHR